MARVDRVDAFRIVCVCTGNVFRSRVVEHFLRVGLGDRLGAAGADFEVSSAGVGVTDGRPLQPTEAAALRRYGLPPDDRPSHRLTAADLVGADLVLCADRSHRSAVLDLDPGALRRTFLVRELARVAGEAPHSDGTEPLSPVARARRVVAAAATYRVSVPPDAGDDIADPWGHADDVLGSAVDLVRHAVPGILDPLVGVGAAQGGARGEGTA